VITLHHCYESAT